MWTERGFASATFDGISTHRARTTGVSGSVSRMSSRSLVLACYRAILRWAEGARGIPFHIKRDHLLALSPALAESNVAIHDAETLHNVTRWIFKEQQTAKVNLAVLWFAQQAASLRHPSVDIKPKAL